MPTYTYYCPANKRTLMVWHPISTRIQGWGALCKLAGVAPGNTPPGSKVERQIGSGSLLRAGRGHAAGSCCGDAGCGG